MPKFNTIYNAEYYYIDISSLRPYYKDKCNKTLKRIKKDYKDNRDY